MKRALVTGGSGGIGAAICQRLAADGHHVIVHANRSRAKADAVVAGILASGGSAEAVAFDITDRAATASALETLLEAGPIQILVNNAGIHDDAVVPGMSGAQWDSVLDVSLNGFFNVTQPLTLPMIRTPGGASSPFHPSPGSPAIVVRSITRRPRGHCTPPANHWRWSWPAGMLRSTPLHRELLRPT